MPDRYCEPMWRTTQRRRRSWLLYALIAVALVGGVAQCRHASAEKVIIDCATLAQAISAAAAFRDADANLEKTVAVFKRLNEDASRDEFAVLEREVRKVWSEGLSQDEATQAVYMRCRAQRGDMGQDS